MFKLIVSDTVVAPVKGSMTDANGRKVDFSFSLVARRMPADELNAMHRDGDSKTVNQVLTENVTGWRDVVAEDGTPAEFSQAALGQMLNILGMSATCYTAYLEACGAKGKEKN